MTKQAFTESIKEVFNDNTESIATKVFETILPKVLAQARGALADFDEGLDGQQQVKEEPKRQIKSVAVKPPPSAAGAKQAVNPK